MILPNQLAQLAKLFDELQIDYAVLGGIAVSYYGEPRFTWDIDVNILLRTDQIEDFLETAKMRGFSPRTPNAREILKKTGVLPMTFVDGEEEGHCDLIVAQNALEIAGIRRASFRDIGNSRIKLIACEDLVLHKIASDRPRDREDLLGILRRQGKNMDRTYIHDWLRRLSEAGTQDFVALFKTLDA